MTDGASEYFVLFHHKVLVACAVEVRQAQEYSHYVQTVAVCPDSLDTWAVLLAFAAALLVRFGVLKTVPW